MAILGTEERQRQILMSLALGPLFPLWGIVESPPGVLTCECGQPNCKSPGKHPRPGYRRSATTDPNVIYKWIDRFPCGNFGVVTGERAIAVDADVRADENGMATLEYLEIDEGRRLPYTVQVLTGRENGSRHIYFTLPANASIRTRTKALPGLDIRAVGGYCVAAGSRHVCGGYYHFPEECSPEEQSIAEAPQFLLAALAEPTHGYVIAVKETPSSTSLPTVDIQTSSNVTPLPDRVVLGVMMRDPVARYFWSGGRRNQTPSEDDFALACKLAFYCRHDLQQMYRLFMQSGLRRAKFDEPRPGGNYAFWTLKRAIQCTPHTWIRKERRIPGAKRGRKPTPDSKAILELHHSQPGLSNADIARQLGLPPKRVRNAISYHKRARADNSALIHNLAITREPVEYYPIQNKIDSILDETDSTQDERNVA
jgi:hypothetical protein